ncbi:SpoIIE family protein phosphatase [Desulfobacula phenolica]|uniref:Stage II sporulation protein E (SpoIIE) n=1 Tax=Desulfobacula phenolica TaxID=90732 RepID=A0A1H2E242_9BACT|nr:SpoIIE family protein phosphatase [Desulfobacula phenolica]SDT89252.1 Stage II sporulation protein E (SpoIIE) [Desulfobacula phenolica]
MRKIDYHVMKRGLIATDNECGDTGIVKIYGNQCFIGLIDALGHGKEAFDVAALAESYLLTHYEQDLTMILTGLHEYLKGTRGAVAAICRLYLDTGILKYSGVGNISIRLFSSRPRRLITRDGIIGYMIPCPTQSCAILCPGDICILSSDGVREHFDLADYPDILMGSARRITNGFIDQLGKKHDDASCIALRYGI